MTDQPAIPLNVRRAVDATDVALHELEGLLIGADLAKDQCEFADMNHPYARALHILLPMAQEALAKVMKAHEQEWVELGGK